MADENINWDDATESAGFVTLKPDAEKIIEVINWKFEKRAVDARIAAGEIEFIADVVFEDGEAVEEKLFTTTSKRLKTKLRPIFENRPSTEKVKLSILRVGETFQTQYSVKELKD